jgi:signal-transduction protein with cAMP-binding, CBS, and nucleotidyltransferase domain
MALRERRNKKSEAVLTTDEMFYIINKDFILKQRTTNEDIPHYILSPTCIDKKEKRWLLHDSRENCENTYYKKSEKLPTFYGRTIHECIYKAFKDLRLG